MAYNPVLVCTTEAMVIYVNNGITIVLGMAVCTAPEVASN